MHFTWKEMCSYLMDLCRLSLTNFCVTGHLANTISIYISQLAVCLCFEQYCLQCLGYGVTMYQYYLLYSRTHTTSLVLTLTLIRHGKRGMRAPGHCRRDTCPGERKPDAGHGFGPYATISLFSRPPAYFSSCSICIHNH